VHQDPVTNRLEADDDDDRQCEHDHASRGDRRAQQTPS
jgi:hypothetical protein